AAAFKNEIVDEIGFSRLRRHVEEVAGEAVIALHERGIDEEGAVFLYGPAHFLSRQNRIVNVLEHGAGSDVVDCTGLERQRLRLGDDIDVLVGQNIERDDTRVRGRNVAAAEMENERVVAKARRRRILENVS